MKTPVIDEDICIGCGTCVVVAGKSFRLKENGKAEVILPPGDDPGTIQEAIDSCAVTAITWKEE